MHRPAFTTFAVTFIALTGCAAPEKPGPTEAAVSGTVTYRERILLPPTSTLKVSLEDVGPQATILAEKTWVLGPSAPPFPFRLKYEPNWIEPAGRYAVTAEIRDPDGRLRFRTAAPEPVLTQGAPSQVDIVLQAAP